MPPKESCPKRPGAKNKKSVLMPGQTKSSLQRKILSQAKKLQAISLIPHEVLYNVFKYLSASDLLRCCVVASDWKKTASIPALWENVFKRLPKSCRDISTKAKTWGHVDWKSECIYCAKERRNRKVLKLLKESKLESARKSRTQSTKILAVKWLLVFEDSNSKHYKVSDDDNYIFENGISIRWNNLDVPSTVKLKRLTLFALTPLFYDKDWKAEKHSVCTRSLIFTCDLKGNTITKHKPFHGDDHVAIFTINPNCYFALWKSSLPESGDIAFVGVTLPLHGLLQKTQYGTSIRLYQNLPHHPILDDVDAKYGMHSYQATVTLRNCRKVFYHDILKEFNEGQFQSGNLYFEQQRYADYIFYDIKEKLQFLWKTLSLKGVIEDCLILDVVLYDMNEEIIWHNSSLVKLEKVLNDQDNYSYENCEVWRLVCEDVNVKCVIDLIKNSATNESTILKVEFAITKAYINQWFGMSY